MKAVVLEIKDGFAAVLSDDGRFIKIKNHSFTIGQEIQLSNPKINFSKKISVLVASAAAFVVLSTGVWAYASPYSYVSLDVNPSIEFSVNRFDRVIHVKAVNDDGEAILQNIELNNLKNKPIDDAVTATVDQIAEEGYFDGDIEGGIVIATSGKDGGKADRLAQNLQKAAEKEVADNGDDVQVEAFSVALERVEKAQSLGVTPGKLNLVEELQASSADPSSINIEDWLHKPVKDIMKARNENRKAEAASDKDKSGKDKKNNGSNQDSSDNDGKAKSDIKDQADVTNGKAHSKTHTGDSKPEGKAETSQNKSKDKENKAENKSPNGSNSGKDKASDKKVTGKEKKKEGSNHSSSSSESNSSDEHGNKSSSDTKGNSNKSDNGKNQPASQDSENNNKSTVTPDDTSGVTDYNDSIEQTDDASSDKGNGGRDKSDSNDTSDISSDQSNGNNSNSSNDNSGSNANSSGNVSHESNGDREPGNSNN